MIVREAREFFKNIWKKGFPPETGAKRLGSDEIFSMAASE
jgi:hypothetical protein